MLFFKKCPECGRRIGHKECCDIGRTHKKWEAVEIEDIWGRKAFIGFKCVACGRNIKGSLAPEGFLLLIYIDKILDWMTYNQKETYKARYKKTSYKEWTREELKEFGDYLSEFLPKVKEE